jgi:hypothetical protein
VTATNRERLLPAYLEVGDDGSETLQMLWTNTGHQGGADTHPVIPCVEARIPGKRGLSAKATAATEDRAAVCLRISQECVHGQSMLIRNVSDTRNTPAGLFRFHRAFKNVYIVPIKRRNLAAFGEGDALSGRPVSTLVASNGNSRSQRRSLCKGQITLKRYSN